MACLFQCIEVKAPSRRAPTSRSRTRRASYDEDRERDAQDEDAQVQGDGQLRPRRGHLGLCVSKQNELEVAATPAVAKCEAERWLSVRAYFIVTSWNMAGRPSQTAARGLCRHMRIRRFTRRGLRRHLSCLLVKRSRRRPHHARLPSHRRAGVRALAARQARLRAREDARRRRVLRRRRELRARVAALHRPRPACSGASSSLGRLVGDDSDFARRSRRPSRGCA